MPGVKKPSVVGWWSRLICGASCELHGTDEWCDEGDGGCKGVVTVANASLAGWETEELFGEWRHWRGSEVAGKVHSGVVCGGCEGGGPVGWPGGGVVVVVVDVCCKKVGKRWSCAKAQEAALGLQVAEAKANSSEAFVIILCFVGEEVIGVLDGANGHAEVACAIGLFFGEKEGECFVECLSVLCAEVGAWRVAGGRCEYESFLEVEEDAKWSASMLKLPNEPWEINVWEAGAGVVHDGHGH